MILTNGKRAIGDVLANNLGTHIAVGVGGQLPTVADKYLQFEVWRGDITARAFDPATNTIHYKSTIPAEFEGSIVEVALITADSNEVHSTLITTAVEDTETWEGGTWTTEGIRMGPDGINIAAGTATLTGLSTNLSSFTLKDYFQMAYHAPVGGGTATVTLYTDDENYIAATFDVIEGYNIAESRLEDFVSTGVPDLANITKVSLEHAGAGSITMDVMRALRKDIEFVMVKRSVIAPVTKVAGMPMDVEESIKI